MAGRGRRRAVLAAGGAALREHYDELGADFAALWPLLNTEAARVSG